MTKEIPLRLGKVVKSNSHCDYVVQLADSMEVRTPPRPEDYGFGCFVKFQETGEGARAGGMRGTIDRPDAVSPIEDPLAEAQITLPWETRSTPAPAPTTVGIIYNSQLFNPQFLSNGPRLSSEPDPLFTPDLIQETRTLLGVVLIGELCPAIGPHPSPYGLQGIPRRVVPVNTPVYRLEPQEIHQFHRSSSQKPQFQYYNLLLRYGGGFATHLTEQVLEELVALQLFQGAEQRALETLCREMAWKNTMGTMG